MRGDELRVLLGCFQAVSLWTAKLGTFFKLRTCIFMKGFVNWRSPSSTRSQGSEKVSIIRPHISVGLVVEHLRLIFIIETEAGVFATDILSLLLYLCPITVVFFLPSFVPSWSFIPDTCSRTGIVTWLRSQHGWGQKWLLLRQESQAWLSFSRDPRPYLVATLSNDITKPEANSNIQALRFCSHF